MPLSWSLIPPLGSNMPCCTLLLHRFAARVSGLASGLALAVRPAGSAEAPGSTARRRRVRAEQSHEVRRLMVMSRASA